MYPLSAKTTADTGTAATMVSRRFGCNKLARRAQPAKHLEGWMPLDNPALNF